VNTYTTNDQEYPSVSMSDEGSFTISWQARFHPLDNSDRGIFARLYDQNGGALGDEFLVNNHWKLYDQMRSSTAMDAYGNFIIAWDSFGPVNLTTTEIRARVFDSRNGPPYSPEPGEFQVNTITNNFESSPSVATLSGYKYVIVWGSAASDQGILMSLLSTGVSQCADRDNDGYGNGPDCIDTDCDDGDDLINPGAAEICGDGADNDCNGFVDFDDPYCSPDTSYFVDINDESCSDGGPGSDSEPFCSIQRAIDTASNGQGILVRDGLYEENLFINKDVTLSSENGSSTTIIDGQSTGRPVRILSHAVLKGFTLEKGRATEGGGLYVGPSEAPLIVDCVIQANGAYNQYSPYGLGGGVYCSVSSSPTFQKCKIMNNSARHGGGVYLKNANPRFINCTISNNRATNSHYPQASNGGGIYSQGSSFELIGSMVTENTSSHEGAGIYMVWADSNTLIDRSSISNNEISATGNHGTAIYSTNSSPQLVNSIFRNNINRSSNRSVIYAENDSDLIIKNCTFNGNTADSGPAISVYSATDSSSTIVNSILWNEASFEIAGPATVTYSDVYQTSGVYVGDGNINEDPLLDMESHLESGSQCIDAGTSVNAPPIDIDGDTRPQGSAVDMGADEYTVFPRVRSTTPADGTEDVEIDTVITVTFTRDMDTTTFDGNFLLSTGGTNVPGSVGIVDDRTASFIPSTPLDNETTYTATITTGVQDTETINIAADVTWSFITIELPDIISPTVLSKNPENGAVDLPVDTVVTVTFDEDMDSDTVNQASFYLRDASSNLIEGTVSYAAATRTASFVPNGGVFQFGDSISVVVTTEMTDRDGNPLSSVNWSFTIACDPLSPTVLSTDPENMASDVPLTTAVTVEFDKDMDVNTFSETSFYLRDANWNPIGGTISYDAPTTRTASFDPTEDLPSCNTVYIVVEPSVTDSEGHGLCGQFSAVFYTVNDPLAPQPTILSTAPASGEQNVPVDTPVTLTFDRDMDPNTIDTDSFALYNLTQGVYPSPGTYTYESTTKTATFEPDPGTINSGDTIWVYININGAITDTEGRGLCPTSYYYSFTINNDTSCTDTDNDGYGDPGIPTNTCPDDNCPAISNPGQEDHDDDGTGDACDDDIDGDCLPNDLEPDPSCVYDADCDDDGLPDGSCSPGEDKDNDGVVDADETDPMNPDSDGDGIFDGTESGLTEPLSDDTDLSAGFFVPDEDPSTTTDPTDADSDDDGILDGNEDKDHDGLIESSEGETDPDNPDSDGDGIYDGTEIGLTEPEDPSATDESAGVFFPDEDPTTTTDPTDSDSDDDDLSDGEEDVNSNGAVDEGETDPGDEDTDDDEFTDGFETLLGTNPLDPDSSPLTMNSQFTEEAPNIDGIVGFGEWPTVTESRLDLENGFIKVSNDRTRLYILIDLLDDTVDDADVPRDFFYLTFDVDKDREITPNVDVDYTLFPNQATIRYRYYLGPDAMTDLQPETFSSMARGFGCFFGDFSRIVTLSSTPPTSTCNQHRVWEIAIDLKEIGAGPGDTVKMGLRAASPNPAFIEDVPSDFTNDFSNLMKIQLAPPSAPYAFLAGDVILADNAIEVTQAIQDRLNTLPLVQDKDTVARVYAYGAPSATLPRSCLVSLFAKKEGVDLPGSPLTSFHIAPTEINRENLSDTVNFRLPPTWNEGDVELAAVVRGIRGSAFPRDYSDPINLTFTQKEIPNYWVVPLNTGTEDEPDVVSNEELALQENYLKAIFPIADVNFIRKPWESVGVSSFTGTDHPLADLDNYVTLVRIAWMFGIYSTGEPVFDFPDQIYGMHGGHGFGSMSTPVWGTVIGREGIIATGGRGTSEEGTMAHEIIHNLGPGDCNSPEAGFWGRHISSLGKQSEYEDPNGQCITGDSGGTYGCSAIGPDPDWQALFNDGDIQEVGLDLSAFPLTLVRESTPEIMSYCGSSGLPTKWISTYRWQNLFDYFATVSESNGRSTSGSFDLSEISDMYYISGRLNVDGSGILRPVITAPGDSFFPETSNGQYALRFLDSQEEILKESSFHMSFVDVDGNAVKTPSFNFRIPVIETPPVASIVLLRDEQVLDTILVSANPPTVTILSPNGGETWNGLETISWEASDGDNDPLFFSVLYSPDDGIVWIPLAHNLQTNEYVVNTAQLPGGDNALIRVIASDGFHTAMVDSEETFTVQQNPPAVVINEPNDGDKFRADRKIRFRGDATDPEDEIVSEVSFLWILNENVIGAGRNVNAALLPGTHEITLRATDSEFNIPFIPCGR